MDRNFDIGYGASQPKLSPLLRPILSYKDTGTRGEASQRQNPFSKQPHVLISSRAQAKDRAKDLSVSFQFQNEGPEQLKDLVRAVPVGSYTIKAQRDQDRAGHAARRRQEQHGRGLRHSKQQSQGQPQGDDPLQALKDLTAGHPTKVQMINQIRNLIKQNKESLL